MWILGPSPAPVRPGAGEHVRRGRRSPIVAATSGVGSTLPVANASIAPASPGDALRTPTAVTSFSASIRVSMRLGSAGEADVDDSAARLDEFERLRRKRRRVGCVDHGVERQVRQLALTPHVLEPELARERRVTAASARAGAPRRRRRARTSPQSRPIVPGPRMSARSPGFSWAPSTDRSALPAGSTSAPSAASMPSGSRCSERRRNGDLLGEGAGAATTDADLLSPIAHVLVAGEAPTASRRIRASCRPSRVARAIRRRRRRRPRETVPIHSWPIRIGKCACR